MSWLDDNIDYILYEEVIRHDLEIRPYAESQTVQELINTGGEVLTSLSHERHVSTEEYFESIETIINCGRFSNYLTPHQRLKLAEFIIDHRER